MPHYISCFQPKFKEIHFFPTELTKLGIEYEVRQFMEDAEEIYKQTGVPFCPCICCHFCIPGSPVCAMVYCEYRRKSRIQNLVKAFNSEYLEKGIFLELDPETWTYSYNARGRRVIHPKVPALDVKMNVPKRREYCTNNGIEFFTLETLIEPQPQAIIRHAPGHRGQHKKI